MRCCTVSRSSTVGGLTRFNLHNKKIQFSLFIVFIQQSDHFPALAFLPVLARHPALA